MRATEELRALSDWLSKNADANTIANISGPLLRISQEVGALEIELKVARETAALFLSQRIAAETAAELSPKFRTFLTELGDQLRAMVNFIERAKKPTAITVAGRAALQQVQDRLEHTMKSLKTVLSSK
ncbi:MAG: hypothetical protein ABI420_01715 [Opitutaceae bacterium]